MVLAGCGFSPPVGSPTPPVRGLASEAGSESLLGAPSEVRLGFVASEGAQREEHAFGNPGGNEFRILTRLKPAIKQVKIHPARRVPRCLVSCMTATKAVRNPLDPFALGLAYHTSPMALLQLASF